MNIKNFVNPKIYEGNWHHTGVSGFFSAYGSFGIIDGMDCDMKKITETDNGFNFENDKFTASCQLENYENGL